MELDDDGRKAYDAEREGVNWGCDDLLACLSASIWCAQAKGYQLEFDLYLYMNSDYYKC